MSDDLTLDDAELRNKVIEAVAQSPRTQIANIGSIIAHESQRSQPARSAFGGIPITGASPQVSHRDLGRIRDIIWDLIIEGYVRPGLGDGVNNDLPFLHVTKKAEQLFHPAKG